jgi:alkaline phosphatase
MNKGYVYADTGRRLQLMIDIKSGAVVTLNALVETMKAFPSLTNNSSLQIVISGNRPPPSEFSSWPAWMYFDGDLKKDYDSAALSRIVMLSGNFARFSSWNGKDALPEDDRQVIQQLVNDAHKLNKKIRFWNAPDVPNSWMHFRQLGIDYINTDNIKGLSEFLGKGAK